MVLLGLRGKGRVNNIIIDVLQKCITDVITGEYNV